LLLGVVLNAAGAALAFASRIVVARRLRAQAFGVYAIVIAWAMALSLFGGQGLPLGAVHVLSIRAPSEQWPHQRGLLHHAPGWRWGRPWRSAR